MRLKIFGAFNGVHLDPALGFGVGVLVRQPKMRQAHEEWPNETFTSGKVFLVEEFIRNVHWCTLSLG